MRKKTTNQNGSSDLIRLASFPEQNPNPIIELEPKGQIAYLNTAARQHFPQLEKKKAKHPILKDIKKCVRELKLKKRKYLTREVSDGAKIYQQQIYRVPQSEVVRIYLMDITDRREAEQKLSQAEHMYQTIFDNSAVAITVTDEKERIISWNKFAEKLLGMNRNDLYMRPVKSLYSKKDWRNMQSLNLRKKGMMHHHETHIIKKNGESIDIDISVTVLKTAGGGKTGSIGIIRDITERKITERKLVDAKEMYHSIFDNSAVAITVTDEKERIISWNKFAEKLLGMNRKDLYLKPVSSLYPPSEWRRMRSLNIRKKGIQHHTETRVLRKDKKIIDADISISILKNAKGAITGSIGVIRDNTERKNAEAELREAKEAAEQASRMKSDFLANMSHEIRTPINGIMGMIGLLVDTTDLNDEQREFAETARDSTELLLTIINDILDFSKIEAGKLSLEPIPFDFCLLVEEAADLVSYKAQYKGVELIVRYSLRAPHRLIGDPGRIRQILTNFISNAVKFTEKGHVLINVDCLKIKNKKGYFRMEVEDTGIGISEEQQKHIFKKFTQADTSTTRKYGGTGLGLAISKELAEMMGGKIGVDSREGIGSTFWCEIPLPIDHSTKKATLPKGDIAGVRMLIVDDNVVNRRVLREQLVSWKIRTEEVASGEDCLRLLREGIAEGDPYQVAVLDYGMPGIDGETLGRIIKADPVMSNTILVMLTSHGMRGDAERFSKSGFAGYIVKPAKQKELFDILTTVWGARSEKTKVGLVTRHTLIEARVASEDKKSKVIPGGRNRILVVEDNIVNQRVAVQILYRLGCRVDVAANGREALNMLASCPYDLIFMDCQMPEMDGYEATKEIRRREGTKRHTPIVAMTANAMKEDRDKCLNVGMDDYLAKPVKPNQLQKTLEKWCQGYEEPVLQKEAPVIAEQKETPIQPEMIAHLNQMAKDEGLEFLNELIGIYLESSSKLMKNIKTVIRKKDFEQLRRDAHTLKGASNNMGATKISEKCKDLESASEEESYKKASQICESLENEYGIVSRYLQDRIKTANK